MRFDFPPPRSSRGGWSGSSSVRPGRARWETRCTGAEGLPLPPELEAAPLSTQQLQREWERLAPRHLGTLGGGNHFLELDRDGAGDLWLLLHSGSRGVGGAIAAHHLRVAQALGQGSLPRLRTDTPEGAACLADTDWRAASPVPTGTCSLSRAVAVLAEALGREPGAGLPVDVHHNHVAAETTLAACCSSTARAPWGWTPEQRGLIPGSMGTASYLVAGRGEPRAFRSCSHGAGRVMTRKEARARIRPAALEHALRRVVFDPGRAASLVEEAPAAYRDITEVLEDEADLVTPLLRLTPHRRAQGLREGFGQPVRLAARPGGWRPVLR